MTVASVIDKDFSDDDDDSYDPNPLPAVNAVDAHLRDFDCFIEAQDYVSDKIFRSLASIKAFIQNITGRSLFKLDHCIVTVPKIKLKYV